MLWSAVVVTTLAVGGCGFQSGHYTDAFVVDAAVTDTPIDVAVDPCALPALTLHVATLSGCSDPGTADGPRETARFSNPVNVALSPSGLAYVPDFDSGLVRKVDATGRVTTLIKRPDLSRPFGIIYATDGYIYLETDDDDQGVHTTMSGTIWKVNPATGDATVIVRDIGRPRGIAMLPDGRLALVDHQHHVVELLDPTTAAVTPLAGMMDVAGYVNGNGALALFAEPYDVVVLNGDLIVTDHDNNRLRRVTLAGDVTDFAGTGVAGHSEGTLATATFDQPKGLTIDAAGAIYVSEAGNHDVRKIAGINVTTIGGSTVAGWHDDDIAQNAMFYGVEGLDVSADGTRVVVADGNVGDGMPFNHVREIH